MEVRVTTSHLSSSALPTWPARLLLHAEGAVRNLLFLVGLPTVVMGKSEEDVVEGCGFVIRHAFGLFTGGAAGGRGGPGAGGAWEARRAVGLATPTPAPGQASPLWDGGSVAFRPLQPNQLPCPGNGWT